MPLRLYTNLRVGNSAVEPTVPSITSINFRHYSSELLIIPIRNNTLLNHSFAENVDITMRYIMPNLFNKMNRIKPSCHLNFFI